MRLAIRSARSPRSWASAIVATEPARERSASWRLRRLSTFSASATWSTGAATSAMRLTGSSVRNAADAGEAGRAEGDGVLGMGVHRGADAEVGLDRRADDRDAAGPADEQDPADVGRGDVGRLQGPANGLERLGDRRLDQLVEPLGRDRHLVAAGGQPHLDRRVGGDRQRLLGVGALLAQAGDRPRSSRRCPAGRRRARCRAGRRRSRRSPRRSRCPPRRSTPSGSPSISKPPSVLRSDGHVERAAAEVVHDDDLADLDPLAGRVLDGRGLGLGERDAWGRPRRCAATG